MKTLAKTTPITAARRVAKELVRKYGLQDVGALDQPKVWTKSEAAVYGWGDPAIGVAFEGGFEWTYRMAERVNAGEFGAGVFAEPYSGWLLNFYVD